MRKKKWNEDDMIKAIALHKNGLSITETSRKCNIQQSSLNSRLINGYPILNSKKRLKNCQEDAATLYYTHKGRGWSVIQKSSL